MYSSLHKAKQILSSLEEERDISYAHFLTDSIKVSSHPESILGIRMGVLRSASKNLAKVLYEEEALTLLYPLAKKYYEYKIVFGGVVERVSTPQRSVPLLFSLCDGWAVPDYYKEVLCTYAEKGAKEYILTSLREQVSSPNPYARRLTVVAWHNLLNKRMTTPVEAFKHCQLLEKDENYYVQMALAWLLAEMSIRYPSEMQDFLTQHPIQSHKVAQMYQQKRRDSLRLFPRKEKKSQRSSYSTDNY